MEIEDTFGQQCLITTDCSLQMRYGCESPRPKSCCRSRWRANQNLGCTHGFDCVAAEWSPLTFCLKSHPAYYQHDIIQQHLIGCCHPQLPPPSALADMSKQKHLSISDLPGVTSGLSKVPHLVPIHRFPATVHEKECNSVASPGCNGLICILLCTVEGRGNQCYLGADSSSPVTVSCSYAKHLYSCQ